MMTSTTRLSVSVKLLVSVWFIMIQLQGAFGLASISNNSQSKQQQQQLHPNDQTHHADKRYSPPKPIPITVLSGFLGSGKTSLLQHLLQNKQGLRIAIIVNDVASVNIDSKLIMSSSSSSLDDSGASGMVQLQNGCACCSKSEELLSSVSELVMLSDLKGEALGFQHIVVEMSGVADPKSVRAKFQEALLYDMPLMDRVRLDTMVTVVDCSSFLEQLVSAKSATPKEAPELFYPDGQPPPPSLPSTDWMDDLPAPLLEALLAGEAAYADSNDNQEFDNGVSELLVGQTETADVLLLNKVDLLQDDAQLEQISNVVAALNPRAKIYTTQYGNVELTNILGVAGGKGVVEAGIVDDHRDAVVAAAAAEAAGIQNDNGDHVMHGHSSATSSHYHDVAQQHQPQPSFTDSTHSHSHDHADACMDSDCTESHSHDHHHHNNNDDDGACVDPGCTDPSHSHSHSHSHQQEGETHAGIGTFVYRARRPFHPQRLLSFLRKLPVKRGLPDVDDDSSSTTSSRETTLSLSRATCDALKRTLRSKGFIWCADSNIAALYWSHAGASFDLQCLGRWWSTLPRDQWPPEAISALIADFDDPQHLEEDTTRESVGDRRQEIVFIGQRLGQREDQQSLQMGLDLCLLNDDEWASFRSKRSSEEELQAAFLNPIPVRMVSY
jgi:G3E family GTPase